MAVLEAVRGYEHFAGLKHVGVEEDAAKEAEAVEAEGQEGGEEAGEGEEELEEGMWSKERLDSYELEQLLKTDHVGLLLSHDQFVGSGPGSESLCKPLSSSHYTPH